MIYQSKVWWTKIHAEDSNGKFSWAASPMTQRGGGREEQRMMKNTINRMRNTRLLYGNNVVILIDYEFVYKGEERYA